MSKSIATGLLAFAVSSSLLVAQGDKPATGGWTAKPGSGLSYDGGDAFGLKWQNRLQVHWTYMNNENAADTNTFNIRRARTTLSGHVFSRNIEYKLQFDAVDAGAAGDGNIKEGHATWNFSQSEGSTVGIRAGQGKTLFGYEATGSSGGLWFVERSAASRAFADAYSRGAWIVGGMMMKESTPIRFVLGAMNTDVAAGLGGGYTDRGEETANSDNELSYVLTANIDPMGDFHGGKTTAVSQRQGDWRTDNHDLKGTLGVGIALGNGKDTASGNDVESTSINLNTAWTVNRVNVLGEYFMRTDELQGATQDEEEPSGFAVSVGYLLDKSGDSSIQWGLGLRYNHIETDRGNNGTISYLSEAAGIGAADGDANEISVVVNAFYHGHACKTQIEYTMQDVEPTGGADVTNHILRVGFQIEF
jgi:hypothetical protein